MRWITLVVFVGVGIGMMTLPGCRALTRSLFNTDLEGEVAPALTSTEWLLGAEQAPPKQQWTVLAFFLPN